jgi:hypothetical protein
MSRGSWHYAKTRAHELLPKAVEVARPRVFGMRYEQLARGTAFKASYISQGRNFAGCDNGSGR